GRPGRVAAIHRAGRNARRQNDRRPDRGNSATLRLHYTAWPWRLCGRGICHRLLTAARSAPIFPTLSQETAIVNRRPVREAGGSRPTARCALGRLRHCRGKRRLMFESLSERLNGILDRLTRRGALSEADVDAALREVRRALIEADVALDVARAFSDEVKQRAVGIEVIKSVTPGQMVVKIVHDQLIEMLGSSAQPID